MAHNLLRVLHPPQDVDYVGHFQKLADNNLRMRKEGPSYETMLRRGVIEASLGNYAAARQTAYDAALMRHEPKEAHFLRGSSAMLQALTRLDVLEAKVPDHGEVSVRALLGEAVDALDAVLRIDPTDSEARTLAEACHEWLAAPDLAHMVRAHFTRRPPRPPALG